MEEKYGFKVDSKTDVIVGLKEAETIYLNTQHGEVRLTAPITPAKAVMALRSAIGILEGYFPKETPYPKTIYKD